MKLTRLFQYVKLHGKHYKLHDHKLLEYIVWVNIVSINVPKLYELSKIIISPDIMLLFLILVAILKCCVLQRKANFFINFIVEDL